MRWLTEDPTLLLALLIAGEALLAVVLFRTGRAAVIGGMFALAVVLLAGIGVERMIVTDNERVEDCLDGIASALRANDVGRVVGYLAPAAASLKAEVENQLPQVRVLDAKIRDLRISINDYANPPTARATFLGVIHVKDKRGQLPRENYLQRFTVDLQWDDGRWLVAGYSSQSLEESLPGKQAKIPHRPLIGMRQ